VEGRRFRDSTGTPNKKVAKDIEAATRTRILKEGVGILSYTPTTLRAFRPQFLKAYVELKLRKSTQERYQMCWQRIEPVLGGKYLSEFTEGTLGAYASDCLKSGDKPATVTLDLALLACMLHRAEDWNLIAKAPKIPKLTFNNAKDRALSPEEVKLLLEAYDTHKDLRVRRHHRVIKLLALTGARVGEILGLQPSDVTHDAMTFRWTKNGEPRTLPVTDEMRPLLKALPIHVNYNALCATFRKVTKALGWEGVTLHTLRHSALTIMGESGMPLRTLQEISGHKNLAMLQRYTHPSQESKASALRNLGHILVTTTKGTAA